MIKMEYLKVGDTVKYHIDNNECEYYRVDEIINTEKEQYITLNKYDGGTLRLRVYKKTLETSKRWL